MIFIARRRNTNLGIEHIVSIVESAHILDHDVQDAIGLGLRYIYGYVGGIKSIDQANRDL